MVDGSGGWYSTSMLTDSKRKCVLAQGINNFDVYDQLIRRDSKGFQKLVSHGIILD